MRIRRLLFLFIHLPVAALADDISVGALLSLSGDYAPLGVEIRRGIELAQEERGAIAPRVEVVIEDMQTLNKKVAVSAAQKLLSINDVDIALSCFASESESLAPLFQKRKVPLMVLWDSTDQLLEAGEYIFSNGFSTEGAGKRAAEMSRERLKLSKVAVISHIDGWSSTFASSFIGRFRELGGDVLSHQELSVDDSDFRTPLLRVKSQHPDGLIFPLVANPSIFLKQARVAQVSIPMVTGDTMIIPGEVEIAGDAAEGVYYTAIFTDKERRLQELYSQKYGTPSQDPVSVSFGYDGMQTVYKAVQVGAEKKLSLAEALETILGEDRSANRITAIYRISNGKAKKIG